MPNVSAPSSRTRAINNASISSAPSGRPSQGSAASTPVPSNSSMSRAVTPPRPTESTPLVTGGLGRIPQPPKVYTRSYKLKQWGTNMGVTTGAGIAIGFALAPEPVVTKVIAVAVGIAVLLSALWGKHKLYKDAYRYEALDKAIRDLKLNVQELGLEIVELQDTRNNLGAEVSKLQQVVGQLDHDVNRLDELIAEGMAGVNKEREALADRRTKLLEEVAHQRGRLADSRKQLNKEQRQLTALQDQLIVSQQELSREKLAVSNEREEAEKLTHIAMEQVEINVAEAGANSRDRQEIERIRRQLKREIKSFSKRAEALKIEQDKLHTAQIYYDKLQALALASNTKIDVYMRLLENMNARDADVPTSTPRVAVLPAPPQMPPIGRPRGALN